MWLVESVFLEGVRMAFLRRVVRYEEFRVGKGAVGFVRYHSRPSRKMFWLSEKGACDVEPKKAASVEIEKSPRHC